MGDSIVWKERDGQYLGFVGGALRFSIREQGGAWRLSKPDRVGLFEAVGTFQSPEQAKQEAAQE